MDEAPQGLGPRAPRFLPHGSTPGVSSTCCVPRTAAGPQPSLSSQPLSYLSPALGGVSNCYLISAREVMVTRPRPPSRPEAALESQAQLSSPRHAASTACQATSGISAYVYTRELYRCDWGLRGIAGKGFRDERWRWWPLGVCHGGLACSVSASFPRAVSAAAVPAGVIRLQEAVSTGPLPGRGRPLHGLRELSR